MKWSLLSTVTLRDTYVPYTLPEVNTESQTTYSLLCMTTFFDTYISYNLLETLSIEVIQC